MPSLRLPFLRGSAAARPIGYTEALVAAGRVAGDTLEIGRAEYERINRAFGICSMPSLAAQASGVAGALVRAARSMATGRAILATDTIVRQRQAACLGCEHLQGWRCLLCGCPIARKIRLAAERCPADPPKWGAVG